MTATERVNVHVKISGKLYAIMNVKYNQRVPVIPAKAGNPF
jgi:hypothetical protein